MEPQENSARKIELAHSQETSEEKQGEEEGQVLKSKTFIRCDLRFFNLQYLVEEAGSFDIILIDPPW